MSDGLQLRPVQLQLPPAAGALLPRVQAALAVHGRPLRWAITAAGPSGLAIEAIVVVGEPVAAPAAASPEAPLASAGSAAVAAIADPGASALE